MNLIRLIARPLLAAPFIADGISAVAEPDTHVERVRAFDPALERVGIHLSDDQLRVASRVLGAVTVTAGLAFATGKFHRPAAAVLASTALPIAVANAPIWEAKDSTQRRSMTRDLTRSLALFGGLLIASTDRVGLPSASWRFHHWRAQRARLAEARERGRNDVAQARLS